MKKRLFIFCLCAVGFLCFFEFYLFYLWPQDMNFKIFFSGIFYSLFSPESSKVISINLYNKSLILIDNGALVKQAKIAGAGHPKATPTPEGDFKILSKSKKVISFTGLIMPLSLRFYGHYFLHGVPTTQDGRIFYSEFSNGCIRLPPKTDEEVYNWADIGTKVEIYNSQLVKSAEEPAVYLLSEDGSREWIPNPEIFASRGFKWKDVVTIPLVELGVFPEATSTKPQN